MQRSFGGSILQVEKRRDRELTLGPMTVLALGLGLLSLCGVCFVFGYAVGHRGSPRVAAPWASSATATSDPLAVASGEAKPAPTQNSFQPRPAAASPASGEDTVTEIKNPVEPETAPARPVPSSAAPEAVTPVSAPLPAPAVVQAVLPRPAVANSAPTVSGAVVRPALPPSAVTPAGSWMVQVAAVSHPEDADVLVSALRKRGYAVAVHRDPVDTLIHVQVGPFTTRNDAVTMRQKLMNDGYNAILQP